MNRIISFLIAMLMSISLSAFASMRTSIGSRIDLSSIAIPTDITVKQTVTCKDGKTIELYYLKKGNVCKFYSTTNVMKHKGSNPDRMKSSNLEFADTVEGKCYITHKANDVIAFA